MKKILFNIICIFFLCYYCSAQDYFLIRHVGISDRHIPKLLITKEDGNRKIFKSDSAFFKRMLVTIIDLKNDEYEFLQTITYRKDLLDTALSNTLLGSFEIVFVRRGKKEVFYTANPKSQVYIENIINGIEKSIKNEKLLIYLKKILELIT